MVEIRKFEDLEVWQAARKLTNMIYDVSDEGRFARDFGLRDQIRRASVSVMSNIAEGFESHTTKLFMNYLGRAKGSAGEVRSQLYVALDRGYIDQDLFEELALQASNLSRQMSRFAGYLKNAETKFKVREKPPYCDENYGLSTRELERS